MNWRLYMDEQVGAAITQGLRLRGVDVLTAQADGMMSRPDAEVLRRAADPGRVLFTRDRDFFEEARSLLRKGRSFPGIVYARQEVVSVAQCVDDLLLIAGATAEGDLRDRVTYLPLR